MVDGLAKALGFTLRTPDNQRLGLGGGADDPAPPSFVNMPFFTNTWSPSLRSVNASEFFGSIVLSSPEKILNAYIAAINLGDGTPYVFSHSS